MKVLYYIKRNDKWIKVDHDTYWEFDGEKKILPVTWGTVLLQSILGQYRY